MTALVSPQAANIERAGFAVLGVVINALEGETGEDGGNCSIAHYDPSSGDLALPVSARKHGKPIPVATVVRSYHETRIGPEPRIFNGGTLRTRATPFPTPTAPDLIHE